MKLTAVALSACAALTLAGCGDDTRSPTQVTTSTATGSPATHAAPTSMTTSSTTTSGQSNATLRQQTCRDILPLLDELRSSGTGAVEKATQETIDWFPTTPEWSGLSETDRQATIAGVRDAAAGSCS